MRRKLGQASGGFDLSDSLQTGLLALGGALLAEKTTDVLMKIIGDPPLTGRQKDLVDIISGFLLEEGAKRMGYEFPASIGAVAKNIKDFIDRGPYEAYKREILSGDGLVLALFMDEGRGDRVIDASGKGNHGTVYGARWRKERGIWTLSFDGVDDYVEVADSASLDITDEITIEAWVKLNSFASASNNIVLTDSWTNANRIMLFVKDDGAAVFRVEPPDGTNQDATKSGIELNKWYHLAGRYNSEAVTIFVNGVEGTPYNNPVARGSANYNWTIGAMTSASIYTNGTIDEVRIYNRALSADEIARHHQLGRPFHLA